MHVNIFTYYAPATPIHAALAVRVPLPGVLYDSSTLVLWTFQALSIFPSPIFISYIQTARSAVVPCYLC